MNIFDIEVKRMEKEEEKINEFLEEIRQRIFLISGNFEELEKYLEGERKKLGKEKMEEIFREIVPQKNTLFEELKEIREKEKKVRNFLLNPKRPPY